jgi:hypothetical protein
MLRRHGICPETPAPWSTPGELHKSRVGGGKRGTVVDGQELAHKLTSPDRSPDIRQRLSLLADVYCFFPAVWAVGDACLVSLMLTLVCIQGRL